MASTITKPRQLMATRTIEARTMDYLALCDKPKRVGQDPSLRGIQLWP